MNNSDPPESGMKILKDPLFECLHRNRIESCVIFKPLPKSLEAIGKGAVYYDARPAVSEFVPVRWEGRPPRFEVGNDGRHFFVDCAKVEFCVFSMPLAAL